MTDEFEQYGGTYTRTELLGGEAVIGAVKPAIDGEGNKVSVETLVAGVDKQILFDPDCNSVHVENMISQPVFFRLDAPFTGVPAGGVYVDGGFFKSLGEMARKFSEAPLGAGHTLHLICAVSGDLAIEFCSL